MKLSTAKTIKPLREYRGKGEIDYENRSRRCSVCKAKKPFTAFPALPRYQRGKKIGVRTDSKCHLCYNTYKITRKALQNPDGFLKCEECGMPQSLIGPGRTRRQSCYRCGSGLLERFKSA